jgi:excinuclease ABC subunit B
MSAQTKGMKRGSSSSSSPSPLRGGSAAEGGRGGAQSVSRPHKPHLDEMGIATWHEFKPARDPNSKPRKPTPDDMGPGVESIPSRPAARSTMGRPGQHGGFRANKKKR